MGKKKKTPNKRLTRESWEEKRVEPMIRDQESEKGKKCENRKSVSGGRVMEIG